MACRSICFFAAALTTVLGPCTLEPHYHRPPAPVPALQGGTAGDTVAADIVSLRVFGGLSIEEAAEVLKLSVATVNRRWVTGKAWLARELTRKA